VKPAFETTDAGFRILGLRSAALELRCAPELGGRVFSLIGRRTGREWLWCQAGDRPLFQPADPLDFGSGTFAGLDECVPTIGACQWPDGRALPDHGELWARPWSVQSHAESTLALTVGLPGLGLQFTRRIHVGQNCVRFEYELENFSALPAPALWSMHPLLALAADDRLELPELPPGQPAARYNALPAPVAGGWLEALTLAGRPAGCIKCFTPALPAGRARAALRNPRTGDALEVHWDAAVAPYLGLWLTRGGYRGWHHLAIEPTNAPYDRVDLAAADPGCGPAVVLPPKTRRQWWVEWHVV
jgi:galactose mutarotase-like enzyme